MAVRVAPIVMPSLFPTGGIKGYSRLKEQMISDWGDAYGRLRLHKQWLAENGASYDI